jgi:hypothetical protein
MAMAHKKKDNKAAATIKNASGVGLKGFRTSKVLNLFSAAMVFFYLFRD